jgi:hypothetical protein
MADQSIPNETIEEIRKRHEAIIFTDWAKEYDPEWQPHSLSNAEQCHQDRATLLAKVDKLEKTNKELEAQNRRLWDKAFENDSQKRAGIIQP